MWRFAHGQDLYRDITSPPFVFAAYPPLYYALGGILLKLSGLSFLPAKLISFFSALAIAAAIWKLDYKWNGSARLPSWAGCFLFLVPAFLHNSVRCHPQMLAVALSVWSLVFFLGDRWWQTLLLSPLLACAALYTKQTQLAGPLAFIIYLALCHRRWLVAYSAIFGVIALIPFLILQQVTHGFFVLDVFQLAKLDYQPNDIAPYFFKLVGPMFIFLGVAIYCVWQRARSLSWDALDFYFVVVLLTTAASLGRIGADGQYVLELLAVSLLCVVRSIESLRSSVRHGLVWAQVVFLIVFVPFSDTRHEVPYRIAATAASRKIFPLLATVPGPILSRQGSFALFSSGEIYVQLFHFAALSRKGVWDQQLLLREVDSHTFAWFISRFPLQDSVIPAGDKERFSPELIAALRRNYQLVDADYPYYIYRPL